jgi:hypothetical protein
MDVALKEVMIEVLKFSARDFKGARLTAEFVGTFPKRDVKTSLREPKRRGESSNSTSDDRNSLPLRHILEPFSSEKKERSAWANRSPYVVPEILDEERRQHQRDRREELDQDVE